MSRAPQWAIYGRILELECFPEATAEWYDKSDKAWTAMSCCLSIDTTLNILSFTKITFYESSQTNTYCEQYQRAHRYMRMVRNKGLNEKIAYSLYEEGLAISWNEHQICMNSPYEDAIYHDWWIWLVKTARNINARLRNYRTLRTWEILVHEFAAINADDLTRRCRREENDSPSIEAVLPVWNEIPVPWQKFGLHCEERNVHLHQRLNGNSLATFCQLKNNDPEDPFDTESPEERSMRYCVYYEKESASDPESESESERGGGIELLRLGFY